MEHRLLFNANGYEPLEMSVVTQAGRPTCKRTAIKIDDRFFHAVKKGRGWQVERKGKTKSIVLYAQDKVELAALLIKARCYPPGTHVTHKTFRLIKRSEKISSDDNIKPIKRRKQAHRTRASHS